MLTLSQQFKDAFGKATVEPVVLVELQTDASTYHRFVAAGRPYRDTFDKVLYPNTVESISSTSSEISLMDRTPVIGDFNVVFTDDGLLRTISLTERLKGKRIALYLGAQSISYGASQFAPIMDNMIIDDFYPDENRITIKAKDPYGWAIDVDIDATKIIGLHPIAVIEDIMEQAKTPSTTLSLIDDTLYTDRSHWSVSRHNFFTDIAYDEDDDDNPAVANAISYNKESHPTGLENSKLLVEDLLKLIYMGFLPRETGKFEFVPYDQTKAASKTFGPNDIADFRQDTVAKELFNDIIFSMTRNTRRGLTEETEKEVNLIHAQDDDLSKFAFPGESERLFSWKLKSDWLNAWELKLFGGANSAVTGIYEDNSNEYIWVTAPTFRGFSGAKLLDGSGDPIDAGFDPSPSGGIPRSTQRATDTVTVDRPVYLMLTDHGINTEIIKCDSFEFWTDAGGTDPESGQTIGNVLLSFDEVPPPLPKNYWRFGRYHIAERGALGTSSFSWATKVATSSTSAVSLPFFVYDVTIPQASAAERLDRFAEGVPTVTITTDLSHIDLQVGDFVKFSDDVYINFGADGSTVLTVWEILRKEVKPFEDSTSIEFLLAWVREDTPPTTIISWGQVATDINDPDLEGSGFCSVIDNDGEIVINNGGTVVTL